MNDNHNFPREFLKNPYHSTQARTEGMYKVISKSKIDDTVFKMESSDMKEILYYITALSSMYDLHNFKTEICKTDKFGVPVEFFNVTLIEPMRATP